MAFGFRTRSNRNFRSSRGGHESFRGRGRGSDNYRNANRKQYADKNSFHGNSFRGSHFRGKESSFDSHSSGSKYGNRYLNSRGRRDDFNYHQRDFREFSSGSFSRDHNRRSNEEPERKRLRSEIAVSYKGGSPRRSYDELEITRSYNNSSNSPYRSESSPFGRSYRTKEYSEFKKPLPLERTFNTKRSIRGSRGRGSARSAATRIVKSSVPFIRRGGVNRMTKLNAKLREQLRRKKLIRLLRIKKEREMRNRILAKTKKRKISENNIVLSEQETEDIENETEPKKKVKEENIDESKVSKKDTKKKKSKQSSSDEQKSDATSKIVKKESKDKPYTDQPVLKNHIALKCIHCKAEYDTFKKYQMHLSSFKHKKAMESLLHELKQKLRRMRTEQREQQRIIDEQSNDFAKTSYCKLCKLNFKQTKHEHFTSNFHVSMNEFLNPRCKICHISFSTPILYEQHRSTLNHIKRKSFLIRKGVQVKDDESDEENNDDDNFMVLDSVGSDDESGEGEEQAPKCAEIEDNTAPEKSNSTSEKKKKVPKVVGSEFIKRVAVYYCKLCRLCLTYHPDRNQEELLLSHCRGRFHLKRYSLEKRKKQMSDLKKEENGVNPESVNKEKSEESKGAMNESINEDIDKLEEAELEKKFWSNNEENDHKSSEDEEDSQINNRFDRFSHSDEKENVDKQKTNESDNADGTPDTENT